MSAVDVLDLVREGRIETHFQPITSIRRQSILGIEALSRGRARAAADGSQSGTMLPPSALFGGARAHHLEVELDRACRRAAVSAFAPLHRQNPQLILFLNFFTPALVSDLSGEHSITALVEGAGVDPRNVAIEILETEIEDAHSLQKAVQAYRERGFLVALDDVGAGHANLDRIAFIKPDLIKADLGLVRGIDHDYHRQEVFKSLVNLSERIGGWLVAEGIETPEEAQAALGLGADILQGFLFARPQPPRGTDVDFGLAQVEAVAQSFKKRVLSSLGRSRDARRARLQVLEEARQAVEGAPLGEAEARLRAVAEKHEIVDSLSVLDASGVQVTGVILNSRQEKNKTVIFAPPGAGTDHSMKEYVYVLGDGLLDPFETPPYVPLPCGELCVTLSTFFGDAQGERRILVAHLQMQA